MSAQPTTSLTTRPARYVDGVVDPAEVDLLVDLVAACDIAVIGEPDTGRDDVEFMLLSPTTDREATVFVLDGDVVVGFVWVENDVAAAETWVDVYAHPDHRPEEMLALGVPHGIAAAQRHRAAAGADATWSVRSGCFEHDELTGGALRSHGMRLVRRFWRMRIDSGAAEMPAVMPELPPGATLTIARTDEDRRRVHAVEQASFADHWNFHPSSYEEWSERELTGGGVDPDGWWLLEVDGSPAAACIIDNSRLDLGDGYVATLGVAREFRGRGLATLLLQRAFVTYRDRGLAGTQLTVDSDSPSGAQRLYESVGMRATRVIDAYALELGPSPQGSDVTGESAASAP